MVAGRAADRLGQFQLLDLHVGMSLVPEGVGTDIDLTGARPDPCSAQGQTPMLDPKEARKRSTA